MSGAGRVGESARWLVVAVEMVLRGKLGLFDNLPFSEGNLWD